MRLTHKKKPALVLSGGGVKAAAFHAGVCLALQEKGFRFAGGTKDEVDNQQQDHKTFRCYVGSSAGSIVASFLASGYTVADFIDAFEMGAGLKTRQERSVHRLKPLTYFDIFSLNGLNFVHMIPKFLQRRAISVTGGLEVLVKNGFKVNGLFTTNGIERYLRRNVLPTNRFRELGVELFIVATQLNHSRKVVFGPFEQTTKEDTIKWANYATISNAAAASASLPPMFAPYGIKDDKGREIYFFDGEIRDTLSTHVAVDHGADLVVASYSIQPYHFNKEMGSLHHYGIPIILNQALYQVVEQKIRKAIYHQADIKALLNTVDGYFKKAGLPEEHRERLVKIMADRVNYRMGVDYIYIHPNPEDYEMFFVDHFSLSPKILGRIVRIGFKSAVAALRRHNL
ncbi:MAG TPA: patatin-like phospholipase family protein [Bdellovibrionales bacterium]|nr:patatin-like phospholipase family protein [Bdellovibrionales bacterium]